ncbi:aryldialkylphosphatase [Cytobacillus firmus]|uniref:Aryldialkylphosphatase n=1 Tax=Cytobacillus firmus TaxID=1399 RepID=A0A800MYR5_CYTFI|nr:aryldialkylphosphatase [Cytobacillus firmus]
MVEQSLWDIQLERVDPELVILWWWEVALKGVREQIFKGAEVIKVSATGGVYGRIEGEQVGHAELSLEEQEVIRKEAHRFGLKVASHAIGRDGILNSILAGVDTIEHGHFLDDELASLMEERNTAWIRFYLVKYIFNINTLQIELTVLNSTYQRILKFQKDGVSE